MLWNTSDLKFNTGYGQKTVNLQSHMTTYIELGQGVPLILIHGFPFDSRLWFQNLEILSAKFKVYAIDLWGFGQSSRNVKKPDYRLYSEQLLAFTNYLGLQRVHLVGHSLGGGVCIKFAQDHRDRIDKLVLVASAGLPVKQTFTVRFMKWPGVGECMLNFPGGFVRKKMLIDYFIYDQGILTDAVFESLFLSHRIAGTTCQILSVMRSDFPNALEQEIARLASFSIPTQLIWGQHDKSIPVEIGLQFKAMLPVAEWHVLDKSGHLPQLEQAEYFNRVVLNFLTPPHNEGE
ncbi:alpha/beta fold hydrolase [Methylotuvimicrobium sp. KM1]|uniref:alpha/beta fold hydrolase n=1 Tax=Methylotuvimicrobium sp. KM1 TaxID=3377707 RepID=UPI00384A81E6